MLPTHAFTFSLPVWRLIFDTISSETTSSLLAVELRSKSGVEWAVIDVENNAVRWQKTIADTDWWTSLIGFYSGVLLFHTYAGSEQPAPKSLLAIDAETGTLLWKLDGYSFVATDGQLLQTGQTQSDLQLNITHRHLRDGSLSAASVLEQPATNASWRFPTEHPESSPYYSVIGQFIQKIIGKTPQKALNYGEIGGHILFFQYLYHANATALSRSILVVNTSKTVLHHETLETDVTSTAFGESFYNEHHLVYLKNLQELVVIKLPKP